MVRSPGNYQGPMNFLVCASALGAERLLAQHLQPTCLWRLSNLNGFQAKRWWVSMRWKSPILLETPFVKSVAQGRQDSLLQGAGWWRHLEALWSLLRLSRRWSASKITPTGSKSSKRCFSRYEGRQEKLLAEYPPFQLSAFSSYLSSAFQVAFFFG